MITQVSQPYARNKHESTRVRTSVNFVFVEIPPALFPERLGFIDYRCGNGYPRFDFFLAVSVFSGEASKIFKGVYLLDLFILYTDVTLKDCVAFLKNHWFCFFLADFHAVFLSGSVEGACVVLEVLLIGSQ